MHMTCLLFVLLCTTAAAGCATTPAASSHTYVLVRHAEKANDDPRDPSLSAAGVARAQRIAESLHRTPLQAVYATSYRRTRQTAEPSARDHGLAVRIYDASAPAGVVAAELRALPAGVALVVGHSNTIPQLAAALCACTVAPIADDEFRRRITVRVDAAGKVSLDDRIAP